MREQQRNLNWQLSTLKRSFVQIFSRALSDTCRDICGHAKRNTCVTFGYASSIVKNKEVNVVGEEGYVSTRGVIHPPCPQETKTKSNPIQNKKQKEKK